MLVDGREDRALADPREGEPIFESGDRTMACAPERNGDSAALSFLISLGSADSDEKALVDGLYVFCIECHDLGTTHARREANEQDGSVPDILGSVFERIEKDEEVISQERLLHLAVIRNRIIRKPFKLVPEEDTGDPASLKALCQFFLQEVRLA